MWIMCLRMAALLWRLFSETLEECHRLFMFPPWKKVWNEFLTCIQTLLLGQSISAAAQGLVWVHWGDFLFQTPSVQQPEVLLSYIAHLCCHAERRFTTEMSPSPWESVVRGDCLKSLSAWMPCAFTQRRARVFCNCSAVCTPLTPISCLPRGRCVLVLER